MFLRNAWYVAAWDRELEKNRPLAVRLLNEDIVLFRRSGGEPAALEDVCVHRRLPLSLGRIRGDFIECGYHGLTYDASGRCTRIPGADRIPPCAKVRSYPVVTRYGLLWLWMGAPELADPKAVFEVVQWGSPGWGLTSGDAMTVNCNYLYMTDNLLDPSHVAWVHPSSFGDESCQSVPVNVEATDEGIIASRWITQAPVAPLYVPFIRFNGLCDRLQHYEVRFPSHSFVKAVLVPAGTGGPGAEFESSAFVMHSYNFLTPIDATHTRYFWFQMRNVCPDDAALSERMAQDVRSAFQEDRVILSAVQERFDRAQTPAISIAIDAAPLRFRRRLQQVISAEQVEAQASAAR